jgi:hypothetical protein
MTAVAIVVSGALNTQPSAQTPDTLQTGRTTAAAATITFDTPILSTTTKRMRVTAIGRVAAGGTGTVGDTIIWTRELAAKNIAGVISQVGATTLVSTLNDAGFATATIAFAPSAPNLRATVTAPAAAGEGATPNIDWSYLVEGLDN